MLIEIHILQNFAPSNLNREDTGTPKDCQFGGCRRARISSQCVKRAVRRHPAVSELVAGTFARRSQMHARRIAELLTTDQDLKKTEDLEEAHNVGRYMFQRMGFKEDEKKPGQLKVMLLLGEDEIRTIAKAAADNWGSLLPLSSATVLRERLAVMLTDLFSGFRSRRRDVRPASREPEGRLCKRHEAREVARIA